MQTSWTNGGPQSDHHPPAGNGQSRQNRGASIDKPEKAPRGSTDPPPTETENGGEEELSGSSREEGGERDV